MRLLLDTHIFLWMSSAPSELKRSGTDALQNADEIVFSSVVAWEIATKSSARRLDFPLLKLAPTIAAMNLGVLHITLDHALEAGSLPRCHTDPFDRMLVAQARLENCVLITADRRRAEYDVAILRAWYPVSGVVFSMNLVPLSVIADRI